MDARVKGAPGYFSNGDDVNKEIEELLDESTKDKIAELVEKIKKLIDKEEDDRTFYTLPPNSPNPVNSIAPSILDLLAK